MYQPYITGKRLFHGVAIAAVIFVLLAIPHGCRDPNDFKPPPDTSQHPPPPPHLNAPKNEVIYNVQSTGFTIYFSWERIDSAEIYELNFTDSLGHDTIYVVDTNRKYLILPLGSFSWRVRAGNGAWSWYTDWSDQWQFQITYYKTNFLSYPPDVSIFITDTFPYHVPLKWHSLGDRTTYVLEIYLDATFLEDHYLFDTAYNVFSVPDSGFYPWYEWRIKAFNPRWIFPETLTTSKFSFIVLRPGENLLRQALDKKWNSIIIKGKR